MSVYKPAGSSLHVYDFQLKGRRYYGPTGEAEESAARDVERAKKAEARAGLRPDAASEMTVDAASARWFDEVGQYQKSAKNWERSLDLLIICFGSGTKLKDIDGAAVVEAVRIRRTIPAEFRSKDADGNVVVTKRPVKASTVNRQIVELMRRILRRARIVWKARSLEEIDWREVRLTEGKARHRELADAEYGKLDDAVRRPYWGEFYNFLGTYGLRLSEMFFPPEAVSEVEGGVQILIRERKDGSQYVIDLDDADGRAMLARKSRAEAAELDTCWYRETRKGLAPLTYSAARSALRRLIKRSGVKGLRIHDLRHDVGTKLTRNVGIEVAQAQLGHADISTTKRYVRVAREDRLRGVAAAKSRGKSRGREPETEIVETKQEAK